MPGGFGTVRTQVCCVVQPYLPRSVVTRLGVADGLSRSALEPSAWLSGSPAAAGKLNNGRAARAISVGFNFNCFFATTMSPRLDGHPRVQIFRGALLRGWL